MSGEVAQATKSKNEFKTWTELLPLAEKMPYEQYLEVVKEAQSHYKKKFKKGMVYDAIAGLKTSSLDSSTVKKTTDSNRSISQMQKAYLKEGKGMK